jgi:hypothetical protein
LQLARRFRSVDAFTGGRPVLWHCRHSSLSAGAAPSRQE